MARPAIPWAANPGPQAWAYDSLADEVYFGGAAGGGKTQLLIGLALREHQDSLILRRRAVDAKSLSKAIISLNAGSWKWNGSGGELRTAKGRTIEVGGCEHEDDKAKYQGQPHDGLFFDELPTFTESQYTFIIGWNRQLDPRRHPNQRCRVVGAGNPPTNAEGQWVLRRWAAWFPGFQGKQAEPRELRWYTTIDGEDVACEDGKPFTRNGIEYHPRSRTFIPARLEDNPDLMKTGYAATLEAMPEPLRSMLRFGDMMASRQDDRWQLIPTRWVVEANKRWVERKAAGWGPVTRVGVDPARGGQDKAAVAPLHGLSISEVVRKRGTEVPDGQACIAMFMPYGAVQVNVDVIGIGSSAVDVAKAMGMTNVEAVVVSNTANWRDPRFPLLRFANVRAAMMWHVRSLLDPEGGKPETRLALPPDPELLADLTAPRYELRVSGVAVESKEDIRERIGRSTDAGDAVGLACWPGRGNYVFSGW
jgi:hypothetical protein